MFAFNFDSIHMAAIKKDRLLGRPFKKMFVSN